jgi:hypothetical protein
VSKKQELTPLRHLLRLLSALYTGAIGRRFFMEDAGFGGTLAGLPDGGFPFTQGIQHGQYFRNGPRRELPPGLALAF